MDAIQINPNNDLSVATTSLDSSDPLDRALQSEVKARLIQLNIFAYWRQKVGFYPSLTRFFERFCLDIHWRILDPVCRFI